jgi:hypothetical protein
LNERAVQTPDIAIAGALSTVPPSRIRLAPRNIDGARTVSVAESNLIEDTLNEDTIMQTKINHANYMKSLFHSELSTTVLLFVPLALWVGGLTAAQAGGRDPLFPGVVRPGNWDYHTESRQGYLKVYSATDEARDGDTRYFPHTSYVIYTIDGKLFKNVKNHRSADDEVPEVVALPVGTYTVVARSERGGYVGMLVVIKEGQQAILDLDLWETKTQGRLAHN